MTTKDSDREEIDWGNLFWGGDFPCECPVAAGLGSNHYEWCMGKECADIASDILRKAIEKHGKILRNHLVNNYLSDDWSENDYTGATHKATLINIRRIDE